MKESSFSLMPDKAGNENFDWKAFRMQFDGEAKEKLQALTLEEKISLMGGSMTLEEVRAAILNKRKTHYNETVYRAGNLEDKGIPSMRFADGTRGVVCGRGQATCFPVTVLRGATFDRELEQRIGEAIAEEILAFGGNLFGGVCVNLPYHPGWGRAQETYGEDSCHLGEMGAALVRGVQSRGVIACVKHFAFNSMENSRFEVNISCDKKTEQEIFLSHFKKCIDAGAGAVMSAYNSYQGVMCGHNSYLLRNVLKESWGFDGFVLCDFNWGLKDTVAGANGGLDMEMPNTSFYGENLVTAVREGKVPESVIDDAALRIIRTLLAHEAVIEKDDTKKHPVHAELALESAREGITLLKNSDGILPLKGKRAKGKIVVLGRLADMENSGDRGSSRVYAPYVVTLLEGIRRAATEAEVVYYSGESAAHCRRLSKEADTVIIVAGNDYRDEGEYVKADDPSMFSAYMGGDRASLSLKKEELAMIEAVASVRKDAAVVLMGGSTILMKEWCDKVGAILFAYYPGMEGGTALGEILFGIVNPGGKLPFVIPREESELPEIDWAAKEQTYDYFHGYTLLQKNNREPLFPFGYGLSYTEFQISEITSWKEEQSTCVSVQVENCGKMAGAEVVQVYADITEGKGERKIRTLKGFQRVFLKPGEKKKVILRCEGAWKELFVGNSSVDGKYFF